jgi:type IV pilus assembly protein PilX
MSPLSFSIRMLRRPWAAQRGIALPVVLVLLLVMAFVGLVAARRAATVEEIGNNARVNHVATQAAQSALNFCEAVVIDAEGDADQFDAPTRSLVQRTKLLAGPEDPTALWAQLTNWTDASKSRITVPVAAGQAGGAMTGAPAPHCIAEALQGGQFLITARGRSVGATVNSDGQLQGGSEVWLQSIITPGVPVVSSENGLE